VGPEAWTGKISYAVYLLHFPLIVYGFHKIGHYGHVHLVATLLVVFIGSYLLFRFVEKPCMGLARQWSVALSPTHRAPLSG
jgi:peptidoglycan/LPS O-acetylase OafA/YrhL